jgi:hypothetical protein
MRTAAEQREDVAIERRSRGRGSAWKPGQRSGDGWKMDETDVTALEEDGWSTRVERTVSRYEASLT